MKGNYHDLRASYSKGELTENDRNCSPFDLFETWFRYAQEKNVIEANAMVLSTVSSEYGVDSRVVLLKELKDEQFVFYTNYNSSKGEEIANDNRVSLNFNWLSVERQIRIIGSAEKVSPEASDKYFSSRPIESQLGAIASHQSETLDNLDQLQKEFDDVSTESKDQKIIRPKHWGGYAIKPIKMEFWQGRPGRLHHRLIYELNDGSWDTKWLYP